MDALILFEACLNGQLSHVPRRPHDRERPSLIKSGHVFIYEEHSSGIKRWTDGVSWSPSRILGNYLIYRELDKPFQPGEKKRAMKRTKTDGVSKPANLPRPNSTGYSSAIAASSSSHSTYDGNNDVHELELERAYVGSLVDSYQFKPHGLIKKTISIQYHGIQHHMVSYYKLDDAKSGRLVSPSTDPVLQNVVPRAELLQGSNFRSPIEDQEYMVADPRLDPIYSAMPHQPPGYGVLGTVNARSMSVPSIASFASSWGQQSAYLPNASYHMASGLPSIGYASQTHSSAYSYDQSALTPYRMPPSSQPSDLASATIHVRRHSTLADAGEGSHVGYSVLGSADRSHINPASSLGSNYSLSDQNLTQPTVNGGGAFDFSGSAHTPGRSSNVYDPNGSTQDSGAYDDGSVPGQQLSGYDGPLGGSYDTMTSHPMPPRHVAPEFANVSDATTAFGAGSHDTPPPGISLDLEHSESLSTRVANREIIPQWPSTLSNRRN
ncbi:hypothetical protein DL771_007275 [Monosporascus sp. 5C6A]|nr:hypothetical protein DL771_007275 [Monosporascus sp. 5C6A]